jgi:hypothetical protein
MRELLWRKTFYTVPCTIKVFSVLFSISDDTMDYLKASSRTGIFTFIRNLSILSFIV